VTTIIPWLGAFLNGTWMVIQLFFVGLLLTVLWGLLGSAAKLSGNRVLATIANVYTVAFRGMPSFLVVLIMYFGLAGTITSIVQIFDPSVRFIDVPPFWAGAIAISLVVGAYATETFRGAFLGIDRGVVEAAQALGLSRTKLFFYIRLPLMWRLALPPFGTHMLSLLKDTALISIIGVEEILFTAQIATNYTNKPFTMYFTVAVIFLGLSTIIVGAVALTEKFAYRHLRVQK